MERNEKLNSVEKALRILLAFRPDRPAWGVRELGTHLGFSPPTVQRIVGTLKAHGFVDQDPETRQYRLGNVYYRFLDVLQGAYPAARMALPYMKRLLAKTRETVHLNVVQDADRVCIDSLEAPHNLKVGMPVGNRSPLYAGASSKCLLAFSPADFVEEYLAKVKLEPLTDRTLTDMEVLRAELEAVRRRGYAASLGERSRGLGSLSAPVFNHRGLLMAALSLAIPEIRYRDDDHRRFCLEELLKTAREISSVMGREAPESENPQPST